MSTESYKAGYIDGVAAGVHYKQRCYELERLCCDMWKHMSRAIFEQPYTYIAILSDCTRNDYRDRMDALGLLEVDDERL